MPEPVRQLPGLTSGHFRAVEKAAPDMAPKDREKWLRKADKQKLNPTETKRSVAAGAIVRTNHEENGRNSGLHTIHGVGFAFSQWKRRVEKDGPVLEWSEKNLESVLAQLAEIDAFILAVKRRLGRKLDEDGQ